MKSAARLPLRACLINHNWREERFASLVAARGHPGGRVAVSSFLADLGCLGIKSAFANPALPETQYGQMLGRLGAQYAFVECAPGFAVKLLAGAFEYARELGFKPDPDYFAAKEIFGSASEDDAEPGQEIEYGLNGKPFFVAGPYDDVEMIVNRLTRKVGADGFDFIAPAFEDDIDIDDADYPDDSDDI